MLPTIMLKPLKNNTETILTDFILLNQLQESVNDKGLFKAVFVCGIPGAGKSYTTAKLTDGAIQPRIVNSDKVYEFLGKKGAVDITHADAAWTEVGSKVQQTTSSMLAQYINGMLPLFIDSTSSSPANLLRRKGILESFGYDCALVWVDVDLETALTRAKQRKREVPEEFIRATYEQATKAREYLMSRFDMVLPLSNSDGQLTDAVLHQAFKSSTAFFNGELQNYIGIDTLDKLKQSGEKYLAPTVRSPQQIQHGVAAWYSTAP